MSSQPMNLVRRVPYDRLDASITPRFYLAFLTLAPSSSSHDSSSSRASVTMTAPFGNVLTPFAEPACTSSPLPPSFRSLSRRVLVPQLSLLHLEAPSSPRRLPRTHVQERPSRRRMGSSRFSPPLRLPIPRVLRLPRCFHLPSFSFPVPLGNQTSRRDRTGGLGYLV